mgnify:CR=1 FL=1
MLDSTVSTLLPIPQPRPSTIGTAVSSAYIEQRDHVYVVAGRRVSSISIVYAFLSGQSAEAIGQASFPVLSLEQVYGAITCIFGASRGRRRPS